MLTTEVWVAKLHEDKVAVYEQLHQRIPDAIVKQLSDKGFTNLKIYRDGLTLVMTLEWDSERINHHREINVPAEQEWDQLTGNCFAQSWKSIPQIFDFTEQR